MEQYNDLNNLITFLEFEGIVVSDKKRKMLKSYFDELFSFSLSHRIISRNDINFIVNKHFLSSFCFVNQIKDSITDKDLILDIGTGAGFPGIILSIFFENNRVILLDSMRKKTLFLKKLVKKLGLFCEVHNTRVEDFIKQKPGSFRFATARAVAAVDDLLSLVAGLKFNELHTIKGEDYKKEYVESERWQISKYDIPLSWKMYSSYLENKVYLKIKAYEK